MNPKITAIIPTYRRPHLLKRALRSVLEQDFRDIQVLVLDNASGDETRSVVEECSLGDSRVCYLPQPRNIGALANVEFGVSMVQTKYFSVLGDDDVMLPKFYRTAFKGLDSQPDAAFFAGRCLVMTDRDEPISLMPSVVVPAAYYRAPLGVMNMLSGRLINHLALTGILFRTEMALEVSPWKTGEGYPFDIEFLLELAVRHDYILSDSVALIAVMMLGRGDRDWATLYKGWLGVYRAFIHSPRVPSFLREKIAEKFRGQLKRAFFKIWFRAVDRGDWPQAYILGDILGEELGFEGLAEVLLKAVGAFRKGAGAERMARIKEKLSHLDERYRSPLESHVSEIITYYKRHFK